MGEKKGGKAMSIGRPLSLDVVIYAAVSKYIVSSVFVVSSVSRPVECFAVAL